ncbi:ABC transporter ATP-binding protein [soil metagenome]
MNLQATVGLTLGTLSLKAQTCVDGGQVMAILGPNGSGKTTLLRALAGLVPLESGRVELDGEVLEDPSQGIRLAAADRRVGYLFQDYLLFPHLSVLENAAFGLRCRGVKKAAARKVAMEWLEIVGLESYAHSRPGVLSGGQAQRVALARALAPEPKMLLLDEPLSALDAGTKLAMRRELTRHLASFRGITLIVTHSPLEAAALADTMIVLEGGRVIQQGVSAEVAKHPRSSYVAELVGLNLLRGKSSSEGIDLTAGGRLVVPTPVEGEVFAAIHPHAVAVHRIKPMGSPRNVWEGVIDGLDIEGDRVRVSVEGTIPITAEVTAQSAVELNLIENERVWLSVKATEIQVYPV